MNLLECGVWHVRSGSGSMMDDGEAYAVTAMYLYIVINCQV